MILSFRNLKHTLKAPRSIRHISTIFFIVCSSIAFSQTEIEDTTEIWIVVDPMPIFSEACSKTKDKEEIKKCTTLDLLKYNSSISYPQEAIDSNQEGKVYIEFVVDSLGFVTNVVLLRSSGYDVLDKAAVEHIKNMPKFYSPGYAIDRPVSVKYSVPILFKLGQKKKKRKK